MGKILDLEPAGIEKRIHTEALEHFNKFRVEVRSAVPLDEITEADLNNYLEHHEKVEYLDGLKELTSQL